MNDIMANKDTIDNQLVDYDVQKKEKIEVIKKKYLMALNSKLNEKQVFFKENYEIFNEDTWHRLTSLIKTILNDSWEDLIDLHIPEFFIDPEEGSYNCYWNNNLFKLLLEISPDPNEAIHIFGKRIEQPHLEHEVRTQPKLAHNSVIDWLKLIYHEQ